MSATSAPRPTGPSKRVSHTLLYLTPVLWGITFPAAKLAVERMPALAFMAWSRALGFVALLITLPLVARGAITRPALKAALVPGLLLGGLIFLGYTLQTWGIERTTSTNAGLITGMYVVLTPIVMLVLFRQPAGKAAWSGVAMALVGLVLLSMSSIRSLTAPGVGDLLVLAGTFAWTAHVIAVGRVAERHPAILIAVIQMGATAMYQIVVAVPFGGLAPQAAADAWGLLLITGVIGSGLGYTFQVLAQTEVTATRASIVLAGESLVAAAASAIWLGERLQPHQLVGAVLMIGAMLVSELGARRPSQALLEPGNAP